MIFFQPIKLFSSSVCGFSNSILKKKYFWHLFFAHRNIIYCWNTLVRVGVIFIYNDKMTSRILLNNYFNKCLWDVTNFWFYQFSNNQGRKANSQEKLNQWDPYCLFEEEQWGGFLYTYKKDTSKLAVKLRVKIRLIFGVRVKRSVASIQQIKRQYY